MPELADPLVGAERSPDLEVDLQHRLGLVLGRVEASFVLLGVGVAVVAAEPRRDADDGPEPLGMRERDVERQLAAEREADERRALDAELVQHSDHVVVPRPRAGRPDRAAEEAEIGADRAEPLGEERDDRLPEARVAEPAVQEQDGRSAP